MNYRQLNAEERSVLAALRTLGLSQADIARQMGRHRTTVWRELQAGGTLHQHLRCARRQCRKRYGRYDSRGRLAGKRMIGERPGRWSGATGLGTGRSTR